MRYASTISRNQWHVVGPGAVGCLWAAHLNSIKCFDVFLIGRDRDKTMPFANLEVLVQNRYSNEHSKTRLPDIIAESISFMCPNNTSENISNLLVCTKASDASKAISSLKNRFTDSSRIILICNGALGAYEEIKLLNLRHKFILGSNTHGSYITDADRQNDRVNLVHAGFGSLSLGIPQDCKHSTEEDLQDVVQSLGLTGLQVCKDDNIDKTLWKKLGVNTCLNALTALLECKNGKIVEFEEGKHICQILSREIKEVAFAHGVLLDEVNLYNFVLDVAMKNANNYSSTYQDIVKKRARSEIPYLNGFVVEQAKRAGIDVPYNALLTELIKMKENINTNDLT